MDIDLEPQSIETEKKFLPPVGGVDIEIDIFADDPKHRLVIEIQRERYDYEFDRFWHYHPASQLELVKGHKLYQLELPLDGVCNPVRNICASSRPGL